MSRASREAAIETLLAQAEAAHGAYEAAELGGVYDEQWAAWYAEFVVAHGLDAILGHAAAPEVLGRFLADSFADFTAAESPESWSAYTAGRIAAEL